MNRFKPNQTHALAGILFGLAIASQPVAAKYETAEVTAGPIQVHATTKGNYSAEALDEVVYDAERYSGELKVAEVLVPYGPVTAGQAVLRLEATDMDEQYKDATIALVKAQLRFAWAKKEAEISSAERAVAAERRNLTMIDTLAVHQRWKEFAKADAYRKAELGMQRQEDRFADEQQELKQLEELYDGARLASRTQDVVLSRARRSLAANLAQLEIARRNHKVQMTESLPNQERDMNNSLRWLKADQANAGWRAEVAKIQQDWVLDSAREAFEDAKKAIDELKADKAALTIKADKAGVMTAIGLEPGDKV